MTDDRVTRAQQRAKIYKDENIHVPCPLIKPDREPAAT